MSGIMFLCAGIGTDDEGAAKLGDNEKYSNRGYY